ncbi:MAG TPA: glycoside hydrolase family 15 protein, partial [Acidimicrobiales bacterium]|nr:glycoside hydrolase family 15 protein [Acidimicrobiales bacterium]
QDGLMTYVGGPDALYLWSQVDTHGEGMTTVADFTVGPDQVRSFQLTWHQSHEPHPRPVDARYCVQDTERYWRSWVRRCQYRGRWRQAVARSLVTLKALTYQPTGGIVAAATTSLPEDLGGERNWDYRYCWLRDSTFTLSALMEAGYLAEARAWRQWLLRTVAGDPEDLQIMYGPAGERRLDERQLEWLPGYEGSTPVRVGNAAAGQYQLDVYGEVMNSLHEARERGLTPQGDPSWDLQKTLLGFLVRGWREPDDGIWEVRGGRRHFTHSKVMAWVAFDRAVAAAERWGLDGPVDTWRRTRDQIRQEVLAKGYDQDKGAFTQYYGSGSLDASLLMIPHVGFLPATDPRMRSTVEAIQKELVRDGFVLRYRPEGPDGVDGLKGEEGAFLPCSFWLVDNLALLGRLDEAQELFERLLGLRNDLGLLSEEYDPRHSRLVGNFPQAFSHVCLVNSAMLLDQLLGGSPAS